MKIGASEALTLLKATPSDADKSKKKNRSRDSPPPLVMFSRGCLSNTCWACYASSVTAAAPSNPTMTKVVDVGVALAIATALAPGMFRLYDSAVIVIVSM
jgi:hypothetical protein